MSKYGWLGVASESASDGPSILREEKSRSAVKSVDNEEKKEFVWCDHILASGYRVDRRYPAILRISTRGANLIVEEGKVKVLCDSCLMKGLQTPLFQ
jgi:hypothetical protein